MKKAGGGLDVTQRDRQVKRGEPVLIARVQGQSEEPGEPINAGGLAAEGGRVHHRLGIKIEKNGALVGSLGASAFEKLELAAQKSGERLAILARAGHGQGGVEEKFAKEGRVSPVDLGPAIGQSDRVGGASGMDAKR